MLALALSSYEEGEGQEALKLFGQAYAADADNWQEMATVAKRNKVPLAITGATADGKTAADGNVWSVVR